jgi:hypothetical protein
MHAAGSSRSACKDITSRSGHKTSGFARIGFESALAGVSVTGRETLMNNESIAIDRSKHEKSVTERFLESPNERSFADLFRVFTPQLLAFFRIRGCGTAVAESK